MRKIQDVVSGYDYDCLPKEKLITEEELHIYEKELGVEFGAQLKEYLLTYGYLGCEDIEFLGINSVQNINSDMITTTKSLHNLSSKTNKLVVVENQGEGEYYLVDSEDNMYRFIQDGLELLNINIDLFQYIEERLKTL